MEALLTLGAAIGIVLLWFRAVPLKPVRDCIVVRLHRIHEWVLSFRDRRPAYDKTDLISDQFQRCIAYPFWLLKNILNCGECLVPYVAFSIGLGRGFGLVASLMLASCAYALYVTLFAREK